MIPLIRQALVLAMVAPIPASHGQLALRLQASGASETISASNVVLHVRTAGTPSPFLPSGPFTAEWSGGVTLDLRGDFQFQAVHAGSFSLQLNGTQILQTSHSQGSTDWSGPVRLRKGTNLLRATLTRTNDAEAFIRLTWRGRGVPPSPLPANALTPPADSGLGVGPDAPSIQRGRDLFLVHRCSRCHDPEMASPLPDLQLDAPSLAGIGSRRQPEWMAKWITNAQALQPAATMPRVLHGPTAQTDAADIAYWLSSLTNPPSPAPKDASVGPRPLPAVETSTAPAGIFVPVPAIGRALFDTLLCQACHVLDAESAATAVTNTADRISLSFVPEKFADPTRLADYLLEPERHYAWSRMPNFKLSPEDATHLASFLLPADKMRPVSPMEPERERIQRGQAIARDRGCFQCHTEPGAPTPVLAPPSYGPTMAVLARSDGMKGCLAVDAESSAASRRTAPSFRFTTQERDDLRIFLRSGRSSLARHLPVDFAERWTRELGCAECHEKVNGLPKLGGIGEKLRPEWLARFVGGHIPYKPRPWLPGRMPAFPAYAEGLAEGYAAREGLPPRSPEEPTPDAETAGIGRKLVSASAGFACVTCHAVGPFSASAVFEAPGVNLAHTAERLLPEYFIRWVRNPQSFDPTTRMPLYFDEEGNSALSEYYDGDGSKTLRALWEYLRPGPQITPPEP